MLIIDEISLIEDIKTNFPKTEMEFKREGYELFDYHCQSLIDYFEKGEGNVPSKEADCIWHNMILYTKKYFNWCNLHFGKVIHHIPTDKGCGSCSNVGKSPKKENCGSCGTDACSAHCSR